tara:strand:- start:219 stop:437 length:219 start_codon:yes stop_codon:yes gene_type:complete
MITLDQTAQILTLTGDEVMFYVQSKKLTAGTNQDTLTWEFEMDEVLKFKEVLDKSREEKRLEEEAKKLEEAS